MLQGVKNAVPKTILQLMNVDGMTRENVASHLQKYRLYLKKLGGYAANAKTSPEALQQVQQVWAAARVTNPLHRTALTSASLVGNWAYARIESQASVHQPWDLS